MPDHLRISSPSDQEVGEEIVRLAVESDNTAILLRGDELPRPVRNATIALLEKNATQ